MKRSIPVPPIVPPGDQRDELDQALEDREAVRKSFGWLISLTIHVTAIILLSFFVAPANPNTRLTIRGSNRDAEIDVPVQFAELNLSTLSQEPYQVASAIDATVPIEDLDAFELISKNVLQESKPETSGDAASTTESETEAEPDNAQPSEKQQRVNFFGTHAYGNTFVYVLDISGSMKGRRLLRAKRELVKSIRGLSDESLFHVVLFSEGVLNFGNEPGLRPATRSNKRLFEQWIARVVGQNGTLPGPALKIASELRPDHVFFLSDGDFEIRDEATNPVQSLIDLLAKPNAFSSNPFQKSLIDNYVPKSVLDSFAPEIVIHTFAYENMAGFKTLKQIAEEHGGTYRFVPGM